MTSQLHISKSEILSFSNRLHINSGFLSLMWLDNSELKKLWNVLFLWISFKKIKVSDFEMWSWDVIFIPFSQKVICILYTANTLNSSTRSIRNSRMFSFVFWWSCLYYFLAISSSIFLIFFRTSFFTFKQRK